MGAAIWLMMRAPDSSAGSEQEHVRLRAGVIALRIAAYGAIEIGLLLVLLIADRKPGRIPTATLPGLFHQ